MSNYPGTILEEYRSRAKKLMDISALATAAEDVCKLIGPRRQKGQSGNQARYAAVHLRLGDVLGSKHYLFSKYVPAETYEVAAIELAAAGVKAVDLYYAGSATWGVSGKHKDAKKKQVATFVRIVTHQFENNGMAVNVPESGTADEDMCAMMEAPYFVMAGGGYSRLIRDVRMFLGDVVSPLNKWWCEWLYPKALMALNPYTALKALNARAAPFSHNLTKWRPIAEKKCTKISELSANNPVDDTYFNWTDIEAHLNQTLFYPEHKTKFCQGGTLNHLGEWKCNNIKKNIHKKEIPIDYVLPDNCRKWCVNDVFFGKRTIAEVCAYKHCKQCDVFPGTTEACKMRN